MKRKVGRPKGTILKEKLCKGCGEVKPREDFGKNAHSIKPLCKPCYNKEAREYFKNNPRKRKEQNARSRSWFKKIYSDKVTPRQAQILRHFSLFKTRSKKEKYAELLLNSPDYSIRYAIMHHEIEELLVEYTDY